MRSILMISSVKLDEMHSANNDTNLLIDALESIGYMVSHAHCMSEAKVSIQAADVIILDMTLDETKQWVHSLMKSRKTPMLWWCSAQSSERSKSFCDSDLQLDGMLTPGMNEQELHWALFLASKQCFERQQWATELKLLKVKLEERKWVEHAKGILCKVKNVSEAEAYNMLRKQAMNERKRLIDVASSVVNVYRMLEES
ncbi:ANTAR domain-containing response regulator [Paenibacillus camelliae]|uniref:ANTAR domain-containing response regulator n=1 Tax=Paenibacillus camelliae TaxID=512410 RepID=UPI00203C862E|nr:ANTAR domain-containing protein [Paenibacillus camelliae]MCM3634747.1 ANTAR domain-containing protein [Paenibacillus camelliae]